MNFIKNSLEKIFACLFVISFLQLPLFIDLYMAHLNGHVEELKILCQKLETESAQQKMTLKVYIKALKSSSDSKVQPLGTLLDDEVCRFEKLQNGSLLLTQSNCFTRPIVFLTHFEKSIVQETWASFKPGLSMTAESLVWGLTGLLLGTLLWNSLGAFLRRLHLRFSSAKCRD